MDDPGLDADARAAIRDPRTLVAVSPVGPWEIGIKRALGKLDVPTNLPDEITALGFTPLPITIEHAVAAAALPPHHRDPFDRMLVAQAQLEGLTIVTRDPRITRYQVPVLAA